MTRDAPRDAAAEEAADGVIPEPDAKGRRLGIDTPRLSRLLAHATPEAEALPAPTVELG